MEPEQSKTQKPRRLWKVIFVISLALNMAVLGVVVGATWRFQSNGPYPAAKVLDSGSIYLRALDKKHRRELGRKMRPAGGKTKIHALKLPKDLNRRLLCCVLTPLIAVPLQR